MNFRSRSNYSSPRGCPGKPCAKLTLFIIKGLQRKIAISERESALESFLVVLDGFWLKHSRNIVTGQLANGLKNPENVFKRPLNSGNSESTPSKMAHNVIKDFY